MLTGKIIKGIAGFYYVMDETGAVHELRARGRFRKEEISPLPGDMVSFSDGGFVESIKKRRNELTRPRVANVDVLAVVVSAEKPDIDFLLVDKLMLQAKTIGITPILIINKCDIADKEHMNDIVSEYEGVCQTVCVSAKTCEGLDTLKKLLQNNCTCLAGQSAAGKSSILNAVLPGLKLQTGELSRKTERGTHTTRQAELLIRGGMTFVDTPGFSSLDSAEIAPEELSTYYDDMQPYGQNCRFRSCLHAKEPCCGVKNAVEEGLIRKGRYERYLRILKEIEDRREGMYD